MNAILYLALFASSPAPSSDRVEGPIDLASLEVHRARSMAGCRGRFVVWRSSLVDEHDGQKHFDAWHKRDVHCFIRMAKGEDVPEDGRLIIEGIIWVWDVPSYTINGKRIEGWTMIRVENSRSRR